jgi:hypothetical protein
MAKKEYLTNYTHPAFDHSEKQYDFLHKCQICGAEWIFHGTDTESEQEVATHMATHGYQPRMN